MQKDAGTMFSALLGKQAGFAKTSFPDVLPIALLIPFSIPKAEKELPHQCFTKELGLTGINTSHDQH